jgi:transcription initiation factor TFIIIB Brf1 subunit/transcription initiation factor TFIIB
MNVCRSCANDWGKKRLIIARSTIDALFSDKNLPVEYKKDVYTTVEKYLESNNVLGYSIEEIIKEITYIVLKQKTAVSCSLVLSGIKKQTSKQWAMSRKLGIKPRNDLVIPRYVITDLHLGADEISDLKTMLADKAIVRLAQGKSSLGIIAAILFIYLRNKNDKFISEKYISSMVRVSDVTLRSRLREFQYLKDLPEMLKELPSPQRIRSSEISIHAVEREPMEMIESDVVDHQVERSTNEKRGIKVSKSRGINHGKGHIRVKGKCDKCGDLSVLYKVPAPLKGGFGWFCERCKKSI